MKETKELPFFAQFLEAQESTREQQFPQIKTSIKAGQSLKYPSDRDEVG